MTFWLFVKLNGPSKQNDAGFWKISVKKSIFEYSQLALLFRSHCFDQFDLCFISLQFVDYKVWS